MKCPSCAADISEGSRFCDECGMPLPVGCPSCGASNRPEAKFCSTCGSRLAVVPSATPLVPPKAVPTPLLSSRSAAERRQLTVMFCDLVGSTVLSARLDPEDLRELMAAYHKCVAEAVGRFEGFVAKYLGDGVLVYFGWPQADEADAERAVRAALATLEAVGHAGPAGEALAARIGIATGLTVVGDLLGVGSAQEQAVVGETPNLAARLQALAEPGCAVIDVETRRRVGGLFDCHELSPVTLKGLPGPVHAWQVLSEAVVQSRFQAMHPTSLAPLVGREDELDLLVRHWRRTMEGEGQVVLISGEPGIGKSRLIAALEEHVAKEAHVKLKYFCSPHHRDSALQPIIARWETEAGFVRGEPADARLDRLEALLLPLGATQEDLALVAEMLGVPGGERYQPLAINPTRKKEQTFVALNRILAIRARHSRVLMLFEDAHWADPSSLELLDRTIGEIASLPVLLVISFRPEFQAPWVGHAGVSLIALSRLNSRQAADLASHIVIGQALPPRMLERIVAQTDGVPLFIEELTKTVLEGASLPDATASTLPVPSTLQASLMARLDRLPAAKQVAQVGAVIGREFSHEVLTAVAGLPETTLARGLTDLVGAGLAFRRGTPPEDTYSFKHALVQDAAYASLLRSTRQELHARIASVLEERFREPCEGQPELLAHHLTRAGYTERAISWWRRAGERAIARSANVEAVAHLNQGLELIATLPDTPDHAEQAFGLLLAIGPPLTAIKGYPAQEVELTYLRAQELAEQLGRSAELFPVLNGLWTCYLTGGELTRAQALAGQLVKLAEETAEPLQRALAYRALGATMFYLGWFPEARDQLEKSITLDAAAASAGDGCSSTVGHWERPGVVSLVYLARTQWFLGFPDRAIATLETALALSEQFVDAYSLARSLSFAAVVHLWRRENEIARRRAEAAIAVTREHSFAMWLGVATMCRGAAVARLGHYEEGLAELHAGFSGFQGTGARFFNPLFAGFKAEAHAAAGEIEDALATLDRTNDVDGGSVESFYEAELCRLRGTFLIEKGDLAGGAASLRRALDLAQTQGAKSLELRVANNLARLWCGQGKRIDALALLAPVHGWFAEGFDTLDLKEAMALLDELNG